MEVVWTTSDGSEIAISDLTDSHIVNILKHFNGGCSNDEDFFDSLEAVIREAKRRGIEVECNFEYVDAVEADMFDTF